VKPSSALKSSKLGLTTKFCVKAKNGKYAKRIRSLVFIGDGFSIEKDYSSIA
jgi:hypothetical protein